jgi:hypothetical protein
LALADATDDSMDIPGSDQTASSAACRPWRWRVGGKYHKSQSMECRFVANSAFGKKCSLSPSVPDQVIYRCCQDRLASRGGYDHANSNLGKWCDCLRPASAGKA